MAQRLPSTSAARRTLIGILAIGYGSILAFIVFWPSPIDRPVAGLLDRAIAELHERGVPTFVDYGFIEFSANVALFVPIGILFGLVFPLRFWPLALLPGPALSALIELAQRALLEDRYATVQDVIANTLGATIGVLLATVLRGVIVARDARVIARYEAARSGPTPQTAYDAR